MTSSAFASPVAINSRNGVSQHQLSFASGLSFRSVVIFPSTANISLKKKALLLNLQASLPPTVKLVQPVTEKDEINFFEPNPDTLTFKYVQSSITKASSPSRTQNKEKNPKKLTSTEILSDKLDRYEIIQYPLMTESAIKLILEKNTLVFAVHKHADKNNIKDAFEKMFKIRAKKVNTLMRPDGTKKAFIVLAPECNAIDVAKKIKVL